MQFSHSYDTELSVHGKLAKLVAFENEAVEQTAGLGLALALLKPALGLPLFV